MTSFLEYFFGILAILSGLYGYFIGGSSFHGVNILPSQSLLFCIIGLAMIVNAYRIGKK
jgi:hypothetical protein